MKLIKLRLILDVDFNPQGVSKGELMANLRGVVENAASNGMLTEDSPAMVETYDYKVIVREPKLISAKSKAIIANYPYGRCPDCYWKIRKDVHNGNACRNCGHVFYSDSDEQVRRAGLVSR